MRWYRSGTPSAYCETPPVNRQGQAQQRDRPRQEEEAQTLTTAEGQPWANPETGFVGSTPDDQEALATSAAFVYTRKPASGFFSFLSGEPAPTSRASASREPCFLCITDAVTVSICFGALLVLASFKHQRHYLGIYGK